MGKIIQNLTVVQFGYCNDLVGIIMYIKYIYLKLSTTVYITDVIITIKT